MTDGPAKRLNDLLRRLRRVERRELHQFRRWVEHTGNLTHLSALLFVPLLLAFVTYLSNTVREVSFLLFPPLAAGTYTLFAEPEGRYASPVRFVAGMTTGALAGWVALVASTELLYGVAPAQFQTHAGAAALGVVLTGAATWALDVELPTAFSTALLVLVTGTSQLAFVAGVVISSSIVAVVFAAWREQFYERRARYLYSTTGADDHVLVPMRGETAAETATFGARLAAAHDGGKVVLLAMVDDEDGAEAAATSLEAQASHLESSVGVRCEVAVTVDGDDAATALGIAEEANCDLVVTPFEQRHGGLSPFVRDLFRADLDVVAFRSTTGGTEWKRVMVPVRRAGDVAHAMIDYAERLVGPTGSVSVSTCIDAERERRPTEEMLADLVETATARIETRVSRSRLEAFLERNDAHYDLVVIGASTNRSAASRFLSPPTFERIAGVETDVAVVHKA